MRLLIDFFPIVLFFLSYRWQGIYAATAVLMVATVVQTALIYAIDRRLQTLHKVTLALVLVFGLLTLVLQDERFIKWKPTVLYGAMALALAAAQGVWKKNVLQLLLGTHLRLPDVVWGRLTLAWIGYSVFMAALNAYVAAFYSTDTWVDFKLWGYIFPVMFLVGQGVYVARHLKDETP